MLGAKGRGAPAVTAALALATAVGCGSSENVAPDAAPDPAPDASTCDMTPCGDDCVDTSSDHEHCGGCFQACTPAQDCDQTCQCPTITVVADDLILSQMDLEMLAPTILGIGLYPGEGVVNAVVIGFEDPGTPTDTDIALAEAETPFVGIGYDIDVNTREFRAAYRANIGNLFLTRRCAAGVAGRAEFVGLVEVDAEAEEPTPIPDGCTTTLNLEFDFGDPCE